MTRRRFSAKALTERLLWFAGCCNQCGCKVGGPAGLNWDHVIALELGGEDTIDNLQPLCKGCHKAKTAKDFGHIAKSKRMRQRDMGIKRQPKRVMPGSRASKWKQKANGQWVLRAEDGKARL